VSARVLDPHYWSLCGFCDVTTIVQGNNGNDPGNPEDSDSRPDCSSCGRSLLDWDQG